MILDKATHIDFSQPYSAIIIIFDNNDDAVLAIKELYDFCNKTEPISIHLKHSNKGNVICEFRNLITNQCFKTKTLEYENDKGTYINMCTLADDINTSRGLKKFRNIVLRLCLHNMTFPKVSADQEQIIDEMNRFNVENLTREFITIE